jgi:hypothetical protein
MRLLEFIDQQDLETALYDPSQDEVSNRVPNDTRKPVITLRHLNRLKRIRALNKLEGLKREDLLGVMYAPPEEPGDMGGMGGPPGF